MQLLLKGTVRVTITTVIGSASGQLMLSLHTVAQLSTALQISYGDSSISAQTLDTKSKQGL